jgi:hypothetical protein
MATARHPKATFFVQRQLFSGLTSFAELEQKIAALPDQKARGDAFEQFVKAFLLLEPEYASKLKNVWLYNEIPAAIVKKLKLPSTDQGIDIVAATYDGEFWAVQCKYRQFTDQSLTWREISTFTGLAFGVCRGFAFGLICSTTERITHVLKNQERIGFCALDAWQELDADFFKRLRAHFAHKTEALKPAKPRPNQRAAINDGHQHFNINKAKRGKLIMPAAAARVSPRIGLPKNWTRAASSSPCRALRSSGRRSRSGCARRRPIVRRWNGFAFAAMNPPGASSVMTRPCCGKTSACRASPLPMKSPRG